METFFVSVDQKKNRSRAYILDMFPSGIVWVFGRWGRVARYRDQWRLTRSQWQGENLKWFLDQAEAT